MMQAKPTISVTIATLITINIMLGAGIFINIAQLANLSGTLSIFAYPLVGLLLLPLIQTFSRLLADHPGATFFEIGSLLHPIIGFVTSWGYFVGKLAAAALGVHVFVSSVGLFFPHLAPYYLELDLSIITLFGLLVLYSLRTGLPMQLLFLFLKGLPIISGIIAGIWVINPANLVNQIHIWSDLPATFPLVLFVFAGFEASCSLGNQIPNASKNAPRIILFSFLFTLTLVTVLQIIFVAALGTNLGTVADFREPFALLIEQAFGRYPHASSTILAAAISGIAASALGSSYSILSSNIWNLHTLAERNLLPGSKYLRHINSFNAPTAAIFAAVIIETAYLVGTNSNIYILQRISACANVLAYSIGTIAFVWLSSQKRISQRITGLLSAGTCTILIYSIFAEGNSSSYTPYLIYSSVLSIGLLLRFIQTKSRKTQPNY